MDKNKLEKEFLVAIQIQMKAKDTLNKALNDFFEASQLRIKKEVEFNISGGTIGKNSCCKSNCGNGGCGCS